MDGADVGSILLAFLVGLFIFLLIIFCLPLFVVFFIFHFFLALHPFLDTLDSGSGNVMR